MQTHSSCFGSALSAPLLNPSRLVRTSVAARIARLPERTMRHYAQTRRIPAVRCGRRCWLFKVSDLLVFNVRRGVVPEFHPASLSQKSPACVAAHAGEIQRRVIPSIGGAP
jgi:hypothetical protein